MKDYVIDCSIYQYVLFYKILHLLREQHSRSHRHLAVISDRLVQRRSPRLFKRRVIAYDDPLCLFLEREFLKHSSAAHLDMATKLYFIYDSHFFKVISGCFNSNVSSCIQRFMNNNQTYFNKKPEHACLECTFSHRNWIPLDEFKETLLYLYPLLNEDTVQFIIKKCHIPKSSYFV